MKTKASEADLQKDPALRDAHIFSLAKRVCSADQLHICSERQSNYLILKPDEERPGVSWWFPTLLWKKETHSPLK